MRVAYVVAKFPCDSETFLIREIDALRGQGVEISILAAKRGESSLNPVGDIPVTYRPSVWSGTALAGMLYMICRYPLALLRLWWCAMKLFRESVRDGITVLFNLHTIAHYIRILDKSRIEHVHAYFMNWPACLALALASATNRSISIACHARDLFVEQGAIQQKARVARFIVTCTRQGVDRLKAILPCYEHIKVYLNHHGVAAYRPRSHSIADTSFQSDKASGPVILAVGRLVPKKGFTHLIEAFSSVRDQMPDARLVILGEGPERPVLEQTISSLALDKCVHLRGWQDPSSVASTMLTASVLVVPSVITSDGDRDGIPNVILEAFLNGLPVVASRLPGISEAVQHGITGLLTEPANTNELADAIMRLLIDRDMTRAMIDRARVFVTDQFEVKKNTRELIKLFAAAVN